MLYLFLIFVCVGDYAGFDEKEPTSKNGGKAEVIQMLKEKYGYTKLFMIGDGITDLEASPPADAFIGKFSSYYIIANIRKWKNILDLFTYMFLNILFIIFPTLNCFFQYIIIIQS